MRRASYIPWMVLLAAFILFRPASAQSDSTLNRKKLRILVISSGAGYVAGIAGLN